MKTCFNCRYFKGDKHSNWQHKHCGKTGCLIKIELSSSIEGYCSEERKFWDPSDNILINNTEQNKLDELIEQQKLTNELLYKLVNKKLNKRI